MLAGSKPDRSKPVSMSFLFATAPLASRVQVVSIVVSTTLLFLVLEMVRSRKLMERYALAWLLTAAILLVLAIFDGLLARISQTMGIATPSNALFLIAFGMVTLVLINFSATISRLTDQNKVLAQRLAANEQRLRVVESTGKTKPSSVE